MVHASAQELLGIANDSQQSDSCRYTVWLSSAAFACASWMCAITMNEMDHVSLNRSLPTKINISISSNSPSRLLRPRHPTSHLYAVTIKPTYFAHLIYSTFEEASNLPMPVNDRQDLHQPPISTAVSPHLNLDWIAAVILVLVMVGLIWFGWEYYF